MKLADFTPFIFEDAPEDDPYADPDLPTSGQPLIDKLKRKLDATGLLPSRLRIQINNLLKDVTGLVVKTRYHGNVTDDAAAGKIIVFDANYSNCVAPNTPENQSIIKRIQFLDDRKQQAMTAILKLKAKITRTEKAYAAEQLNVKKGGKTSGLQMSDSAVPRTLQIGRKTVTNPYFNGKNERYAGDPLFYKWPSTSFSTEFIKLEQLLTSNGFEGFKELYASQNSTSDRYYIVAIGAKGQFVWSLWNVTPKSAGTSYDSVWVGTTGYHTFRVLKDANFFSSNIATLMKK